MSNYCKECYKKQEEIEQLQAEKKELESSLVSQESIILTLETCSNDLSQCANKLYKALQEIRDIVSEPCIVDENCQTCNSGCMQKDILAKINEVIGAE